MDVKTLLERKAVSIVLPFHNATPWIAETIQSIQDQRFDDWELIAIDDFSTDNSLTILKSHAEKDKRINIFQNEKKGIIPALNLALSKAQGEFITRMDADDIMPMGRLELMVNTLKSLPKKTVVTGKVKYFSGKGGLREHFDELNVTPQSSISSGYLTYESWLNERIELNDHYDHIYRECVVASPNWMTRTEDIRAFDIFSKLNYPEDYDMTFRWMKNGFQIHPINEVTLLWREHPARTSRNSEIYDQASFFELKLDWFCQLQNTDSIAILGAGTKGKITAEFFNRGNIHFDWYDLEWKKYGASVLGKQIKNYESLQAEKLLIAVYPKNKKPLLDFITEKGFEIGRNAWFL